ncbi:MAG: ATP-binding domain-containing protein, partial [Bombilactobacillus mellis]|nr:ATP-binding domain-containing protein [Bombilactobacillus mellis]
SVAIITKNIQQAQTLQQHLGNQVLLLQEESTAIPDGIIVLPVYLAKGLEFDCVIGYDISAANYQTSGDWGILYTIATRALHELYFTSTSKIAAIFHKIKPQTLNIKKLN